MAKRERPWWRDIQDRERRPIEDEEGGAIMHAVNAMLRGDLQPLAEYLRAGYPLNYMVRREIVAAIEGTLGNNLYSLKLIKNRRGPGNAITPLHTELQKLKIGRPSRARKRRIRVQCRTA